MVRPPTGWAGKNVPVPLLQGVNGYHFDFRCAHHVISLASIGSFTKTLVFSGNNTNQTRVNYKSLRAKHSSSRAKHLHSSASDLPFVSVDRSGTGSVRGACPLILLPGNLATVVLVQFLSF